MKATKCTGKHCFLKRNTTPLDELTIEIKVNSDLLSNIMKGTADLKLSSETYQNIRDDKFNDTVDSIGKIKENFNKEIEKLKKDNGDTYNKLGILEDR